MDSRVTRPIPFYESNTHRKDYPGGSAASMLRISLTLHRGA